MGLLLDILYRRGGRSGWLARIVVTLTAVFLYIRAKWRAYIKNTYDVIPLPAMEDYSEAIKNSTFLYLLGGAAAPPREQIAIFEAMGKPEYFKGRLFFLPHIMSTNKADLNLSSTKRKSALYEVYRRFLGYSSIIFQEGDKARKERGMLNKGFGQQTYRSIHPIMMQASERLKSRMLDSTTAKGYFDSEKLISRSTLEVIAEGGFSFDAAKDENVAYLDALKLMLRLPGNPICILPCGADFIEWYHQDSMKLVKDLLDKTITKRLEDISTNGPPAQTRDLLDLVIVSSKLTENGEKGMDVSWIRDQVQLLFIGGSDTSSVTLLWGFILLAFYPEVQKKIKQEIKQVFASTANEYDRMNKLVYVEAFIKEVLRLYSPFSAVARRVDDGETEFQGYPIRDPKWSVLCYNANLAHRKAEYFPDPDEFIPERWLDGRIDQEAFGSFSSGFRACLGKNFAMIEMKTIVGVVLENHTIVAKDPMKQTSLPAWGMVGQVSSPIEDFPLKLVPDVL